MKKKLEELLDINLGNISDEELIECQELIQSYDDQISACLKYRRTMDKLNALRNS